MTKKEKKKEYHRKYYIKNKKRILERQGKYYIEHREEKAEYYVANREKIIEQRKKYGRKRRAEKPWETHFKNAKQRCTYPNDKKFQYYGGRGIKFLLTMDWVEYLYKRDNAKDMEQSSIDRIDNDGNYTLENCRFVEMSENRKRK